MIYNIHDQSIMYQRSTIITVTKPKCGPKLQILGFNARNNNYENK